MIATALGVSTETVRRWIRAGKLRRLADLKRLLRPEHLAHRLVTARAAVEREVAANEELRKAKEVDLSLLPRSIRRAMEYAARGAEPKPTGTIDADTRGIVGKRDKYWDIK